MPIKIPTGLPTRTTLEAEGVAVIDEADARVQDIRPLQIGLLNLMPNKQRTETQFARLIGATPLQVELTLVRPCTHKVKTASQAYLDAYYKTFDEVKAQKFDGFIVTGAPLGHLRFEQVNYWQELRQIFDWTQTHVHSSMHICWGAQAALYHFHQVSRTRLAQKAFGVFRHQNLQPNSPYLSGFSDDFSIPVSRINDIKQADLPADLVPLITSEEVGLCLIGDAAHRCLYMLNHIEYDENSLKEEYERDMEAGNKIDVPKHYFPHDDPTQKPSNRWRSQAHLFFGNWINQTYQTAPFDLEKIGC